MDADPKDAGDDFISVAIQHGLLGQNQAEEVIQHARLHHVHPSDAALQLSVLHSHEVEAIRLLCDPKGLAPGYELIGLIGCGAAGMVFRARQEALGRDVALKTINPQSRTAKTTGEPRIQREAYAIARLQHPGIVAAIDSGFHQGRFCIAMELVEGETLVEFIANKHTVSEFTAWQLARQVAHALAHAASHGIVHRDIKPANLLLCDPPIGTDLPPDVPFVKVADFGLAFDDGSNQITATGATLGTPAYVAPEQLREPRVGVHADIYSLGATVFHMLTGHPPCIGQSPMKTIMQKSIGDQRWREALDSKVSSATRGLFLAMTEANLDERIPDYETLIRRIEDVLVTLERVGADQTSELSVSASAASSEPKTRAVATPMRQQSWPMLAIAAVVVTLISSATFFAIRGNASSESKRAVQAEANQWVVDGFPQPLFNGDSVPLFRQSGRWLAGMTADGSRVLVGSEGSRMTIPLSLQDQSTSNLRLRLSANLPSRSEAEIGIRFSDRHHESGTLRITKTEVQFGSGRAEEKSGPPTIRQLSTPVADDSVFHQIAVFRQGGQAILSVDGETLATLPCSLDSTASIELRCVTGPTNFADIDVVALEAGRER